MNRFDMRKDAMEKENSSVVEQVEVGFGEQERAKTQKITSSFSITKRNGNVAPLDVLRMRRSILWASLDGQDTVDIDAIVDEALKNSFNGISKSELEDAFILAASAFIERDPAYSKVSARLLRKKLFKQVTGRSITRCNVEKTYRQAFIDNICEGIEKELFDKQLLDFDLERLAEVLEPERDELFEYMGIKTLYSRYFVKHEDRRLELPQAFWMRVAMGISYNEPDKNEAAIKFYHQYSQLRFVSSTPTLLHSGLARPQLSSCFLNTVSDDLKHIFKCIGDNAQLSKWSGGLATDWSNIRATGSWVKSIKTESQGVIPYLKIANDTTAAINRSGKRRSAAVVYLETWHFDIEDFLDLRRNTGDERRRTHDINTANWIPDLFMKRVMEDGDWTLMSPEEAPELHHLYGKAFEEKYKEYEEKVRKGELKLHKIIKAKALWRKMLTRLFETGHPWFTFKDVCNVRSPQDHVGIVHSSNLCTEITLNTSAEETAVCNLASVNLGWHVVDGKLDEEQLVQTIHTGIRMLDNVIDINFYPTKEAETSNLRHRPIGMGIMGLQDALYKLDIPFDSPKALEFIDSVMEKISYHAILASSELAKEKGAYSSFKGSKWDRDIFPVDTIDLLEKERGMKIECDRISRLDWTPVREHVKKYGMRNSNTMAIAPTATIANISGCFPCIEPIYKNLYVKANMSGEFTVVNKYLIEDLKARDLWNDEMLDQLKYYDGSVQMIERVPQDLKDKYKEAFELDPIWMLKLTAARGKWIDQSQSHNVFMRGVSGKLLNDIYMTAWKLGLKTLYYLRTLGASQIEKSTLDAKKFGYTQKREYKSIGSEPNGVTDNKTMPISDDIV